MTNVTPLSWDFKKRRLVVNFRFANQKQGSQIVSLVFGVTFEMKQDTIYYTCADGGSGLHQLSADEEELNELVPDLIRNPSLLEKMESLRDRVQSHNMIQEWKREDLKVAPSDSYRSTLNKYRLRTLFD